MNYGSVQRFEDFYPISNSQALIVNGKNYNELVEILRVDYKIHDTRIRLSNPVIIQTGKYLRLGNIYSPFLIFSDNNSIYKLLLDSDQPPELICEGLQPYMFEGGLVYQKQKMIYLNDDPIIAKSEGCYEIGRPTVFDCDVYYEANKTKESPTTWEIWKYNLIDKSNMFMMMGANPFRYKDKLFYSFWVNGEFELRYASIS